MNASYAYGAEKSAEWMRSGRVCFVILDVLYLTFVYYAPQILRHRRKPELREVMFVWNWFNLFSDLLMLLSILPNFIRSLRHGLYGSVCLCEGLYTSRLSGYAMFMFHLSKAWELFDTVLLILRGRPLLVVHVYHHAITLLLATFTYYRIGAIARWGVFMNLSTHILMYGYFCAQTLTKQIPRRFAVIITFLQTAQFAAGFLIVLLAKRYLKLGMKCEVNTALLNFNLLALTAFFVLFSHHYATKFCNLDAQRQYHRQERLKRF